MADRLTSIEAPLSDHERALLDDDARTLASLAARSVHPEGGFGWLGPDNLVDPDRGVATWITCRMTHVLACEVMRGASGLRPLLDVGYDALAGRLRDHEHGGWYAGVGGSGPDAAGAAPGATDKVAYAHAFVILAAASLTAAGHPRGKRLLDEALATFDRYFWDESVGMAREQYDRAWTRCEPYRGVNANMHTVEAMFAVGEITGDVRYGRRGLRILETVVHGIARAAQWRLPEHFDGEWQELPSYNKDNPADPFRPYGVTIGHVLEWSRLTIDGLNGARLLGDPPPEWMVEHAEAMFASAVRDGWAVDGADGFVYTTDYDGTPIVRERLHWVCCEAIAAAWALYIETGDQSYRAWYDRFWAYARRYLLDPVHGGWVHELSPSNEPSEVVWWGKPDVYHAYQCDLVPLLRPDRISFAGALRRR